MADRAKRYSDNVPGKYYIDDQCTDCDLCRESAPDNLGATMKRAVRMSFASRLPPRRLHAARWAWQAVLLRRWEMTGTSHIIGAMRRRGGVSGSLLVAFGHICQYPVI